MNIPHASRTPTSLMLCQLEGEGGMVWKRDKHTETDSGRLSVYISRLQVWLQRNVRTSRSCQELDNRDYGSFRAKQQDLMKHRHHTRTRLTDWVNPVTVKCLSEVLWVSYSSQALVQTSLSFWRHISAWTLCLKLLLWRHLFHFRACRVNLEVLRLHYVVR